MVDMDPSDPCGLGHLLGEDNMLRFSSAVSDHCPAIAKMFNATKKKVMTTWLGRIWGWW